LPELPVSAEDLANLRESGLTDLTILLSRIRTVTGSSSELARILNRDPTASACLGGLLFPYHELDGKLNHYARLRPHHPRNGKDGKVVKYESPAGEAPRAYYAVPTLPKLRDGVSPVHWSEGEKKALCKSQLGLASVGLGGVWSWKKKDSDELLDDILPLAGNRDHYITFDWDPKPETRRQTALAARRFARALRKAGAKEVYLVELPPGDGPGKVGEDDFIVAKGGEAYLALVAAAKPVPDKVRVVVGTDEHRVNEECEAALVRHAKGIYQRGGQLARVVRHEPEGRQRINRPPSAPVVKALPAALLREELTRHVECVRRVKTQQGFDKAPATLPGHVVSTVHARGGWKGLPYLEGVYSHPVLLPDGTVLVDPGYHPDSGILLWLPEGLRVSIPDRPALEDAQVARDALLDVVCDFPFKAEAHKAAWVASLLTPLARPAFRGPVPLPFADGNVPGCGKGLLLDVAFIIVLGRQASVLSYTNDQEELRKLITTVAMSGDEVVLFDNVAGAFGNATLDRLLTASWWKDRVLGGNSEYDGPMLTLWTATGNNVYLVGDTPRRVLPIRLESSLENPEDREGLKYPKLKEYVTQHRGQLLGAALTMLRAYCVAGRPDQGLKPWGSFEGWSDLVRGAVKWCGLTDPADAREELRRVSSPETTALMDLLTGIRHLDPDGRGITVSEILSRCEFDADPKVKALKEALCTLCPKGVGKNGLPNAQSLGQKLHHLRARVVGGLCLERLGEDNRGAFWRVADAGGSNGSRGSSSGPTQ
jgi:hypothetical protein